jgi:hypothetical protein
MIEKHFENLNKNGHLDLGNSNLTNDFFDSDDELLKIMYTSKNLFLNDNKITKLDLSKFTNLVVLDIGTNPLKDLINIPNTLEELTCNDCEIESLPSLQNLKHLICNNNKINKLEYYENIESIDCSNNNINCINYSYPKLRKLSCSDNPIIKFCLLSNLQSLDCINTNIYDIPYFPKLKNLSISNTKNIMLPDVYKIISCIQTDNIIDIFFE